MTDPAARSFSDYTTVLFDWWQWNWLRSKTCSIILSGLFLAYLGLLALVGSGPTNRYGNDVFLFLDGAWRILNHQVPYRDFYLSLGPMPYTLVAMGMTLANGGPDAIAFGNVLFGLVIGPWALVLARKRMPAFPAVLLAAWVTLIGTGPTPLGSNSSFISYAMLYNRQGYALISIVLLECALPAESPSVWGGISTGLALASLGLLKFNFFVLAVAICAASFLLVRASLVRLGGIALGFTLPAVLYCGWLHLSLREMMSALVMTIEARSSSLQIHGVASDLVRTEVGILISLVCLCALLLARPVCWWSDIIRRLLIGLMVVAVSEALLRTNTDEVSSPLLGTFVLILVGDLAAAYKGRSERSVVMAVTILSLGLLITPVYGELRSIGAMVKYLRGRNMSESASIRAPGLERLRFYDGADDLYRDENGRRYVSYINAGLLLLNRSSTPQEKILSLGFHDPFSYALKRIPARGGGPWFLLGNNISTTVRLDEERMFGNADIVMVPHYPSTHEDTDQFLWNTYSSYLLQHFNLAGNSQWWSLYRRK